MKVLRFYRMQSGKAPFIAWLEGIKDMKAVAQINNRVRRLALGQRGDYKQIGKGLLELRIHSGPGYRIYFAEQEQDIVILLLGGHKGSQKRNIQQATAYWQDYQESYYG